MVMNGDREGQAHSANMRVAHNFALCKVLDMTLREYMDHEGLNLSGLAARLGKPVPTVHGWITKRRRPGWDDVALIEERTGGLVAAADFVPRKKAEIA
jgi:hypothetical protein